MVHKVLLTYAFDAAFHNGLEATLLRVLDLSPSCGSALEVTQRRLVLSGTRLPTSSPVLRTLLQSAQLVKFVLSPRASLVVTRVFHFSSDPRLARFLLTALISCLREKKHESRAKVISFGRWYLHWKWK